MNPRQYQLVALKYALSLEIRGIRHSRGSVYALVKKRFGFKGTKQRVYEQLCKRIREEVGQP